VAAVTGAAEQLDALRSYRFTVDIVGTDVVHLEPSSLDLALRGTLTHSNGLEMDALVGFRMRETNGTDAAISGTDRLLIGGGYVWTMDNVSGVLEPSSADSTGATFVPLTPEGLASRLVVPFAAGYRRTGRERHGGVPTVHYRASTRGAAAYASALHFEGAVTADVWIASDGGYLSAVDISGTDLLVQFDITHPDDPTNVVTLPVAPVSDPLRSSGPPVDMQLVYEVMPSNETTPTDSDLGAIAVTLRRRLDVSTRPVDVTVARRGRIVVTVCDTTRAEEDRRRMLATGALTVVPLPASDYGSTAKRRAEALPAVGSSIDPALKPIAPAARVGLSRAHVDPATGRRGVAFVLGNEPTDVFRAYAAAHPGEFVAIVLDGVVLATLPIEGQVAQGTFAFTGDYTEAETRLLAQDLYSDPLPFQLRLLSEAEFPASGS